MKPSGKECVTIQSALAVVSANPSSEEHYSRPENPKRHGFDSSIKLSPLQNYGSMNLQNHGLSDRGPMESLAVRLSRLYDRVELLPHLAQ